MIIWGGETPGASSSGGRYCALSCASPATWYRDDDADGFGKTDDPSPACDQPAGYASAPGDCDDADPAIHPGAADVCNGLDDDCDGVADELLDVAMADARVGKPCGNDANLPLPCLVGKTVCKAGALACEAYRLALPLAGRGDHYLRRYRVCVVDHRNIRTAGHTFQRRRFIDVLSLLRRLLGSHCEGFSGKR